MIEHATPLKAAIVNQAQGMARPVTHTAMRGALGVVMVLAVAAALWHAKTAIFLAFASIRALPHDRASASRRARHRGGRDHRILRGSVLGAGPTIAERVTQLATSVATGSPRSCNR